MRVLEDQKVIFISTPKCGSITGFTLMEELGAKAVGSFHEVVVPDKYLDYTAFTFTRYPYDRVASLYKMLTDPGDGTDLFRMINHGLYKESVNELDFKTFCKWLGTLDEDDYLYEVNTNQHTHLAPCNVELKYIKIEDRPLVELNKFMTVERMPWENRIPGPHFEDFADQECLDLVNQWAGNDFDYGYVEINKL